MINNPVLSVPITFRVPRGGWDTRGGKMGMTSLETGEGDLVSTIFSQSDVQAAVTTCLMNNSHLFLTDLCA